MSLGYYKRLVRICLKKAVKTAYGTEREDIVNLKMQKYEEEFPEFLERNFSPEVAATAILLDF